MPVTRKLIFACALATIVLAGLSGCLQKSLAQRSGPGAVGEPVPFLIQPANLDLGEVEEGKEVQATLFVRNTGLLPLHIADVQSPCGCTVSDLQSRVVPPGGFTVLKVRIDTTAKGGAVKKKVTVTDSFGRSADAWLAIRVKENLHAGDLQGRGIFSGKCAACHVEPAKGKTGGADIYAAVCSMCHGGNGEGAYAPELRGLDARGIRAVLQYGLGRQMPAFARGKGGPLTEKQLVEVAKWLSGLDAQR